MSSKIKGCWYCLAALLLILTATTTIILTSFNLNNLLQLNSTSFIKISSLQYQGDIGPPSSFCENSKFLVFGWLCGFMTIAALFTGIFAFCVRRALSRFALFFLVFSGFTAFVTSIITSIVTGLILHCHVTLTGKIPYGILFIGIFSLLQSLLCMICFFKVCCRRIEEAFDLKNGIESLPDPWQLDEPEKTIIVQGNPMMFNGKADDNVPIFSLAPMHVSNSLYSQPPTNGFIPSTVLTNVSALSPEKKVVLNSAGPRASVPLPVPPRQQTALSFDQGDATRLRSIDRVTCPSPSMVYNQHSLPFNCKPLH